MKAMSLDFNSRRSMVISQRGMVATSHPLAAQAGLAVLRKGGNAADAAIATAAVLCVVEAAATGLGGDCFALYYDAKTREITALNGSGRAPAKLTIDVLRRQLHTAMPERSVHSITVPGTVMGWQDLLSRHGTMGLRDLLDDAIHYAREGFPVSPVYALAWERMAPLLAFSTYGRAYLPEGAAPRAGQVVRLPELADTLQRIQQEGAKGFYEGDVADAIVATIREKDGLMSHSDLQQHRSTWDRPIATDFYGVRVYECPPNGQGLAALIALNIIGGWELEKLRWDDPQRVHLMVEAMRLAFADARHYVADPATHPAPLDFLLSEDYAAQRRALVTRDKAMEPPSYGKPITSSDTVYLTVTDAEGNACSFINSLYMGFGSGIVAKGTGVFLQNRGALFSLTPGQPNMLEPAKRPYHTIIPGLATKDGELWSSFGVMGGFMQPQGHVQVLAAMLLDELNPQEALDQPRWCLMDGDASSPLALEDGMPVAGLARMGHSVRPMTGVKRATFGSGQIILRDDAGVYYGGTDPRKDGIVAGY